MDPYIIVFGLGVGVLVGTTGMGGGSLMTPLLILVFGIKPVVAVGTDLAYAAVTKTVGGYRHLRKGTVHRGLALWLAVGSCPGALTGVWVLDLLREVYGRDFDEFLLILIAGALLLTGLLVLLRALMLVDASSRERADIDLQLRHKVAAVVLGLTIGFVLGVTSAGSGTLIAVGLIVFFRLTPHRVVGTDVVHAALLLWVAAAAHLVSGNVDLALAGNILIGSIPGVWVGASIASSLPAHGLRPALGIVLLASGLGLITKAGVGVPAAVLVGVPLALATLTVLVLRHRAPVAEGARS
jgi:uncharacterized membrane protein YfcA